MPSLTTHLERLAAETRWTYRASATTSSESAAWAAIALSAHGQHDAALRPAQWLASAQQRDGSVGVSAGEDDPRWPTSLAMLAWTLVDGSAGAEKFSDNVSRGIEWGLNSRGKSAPRSPQIGHNTELVGWSWAADTHSWLEPTCMFVLGLRAAGLGDHPRVREGVRLIVDRLLPNGGANYGNTIVLGQPLVPHVQPTGLAMLALAGESVDDARIDKSLDYLEQSVGPMTAPASLAFACLGLTPHNRRPLGCDAWIEEILNQTRTRLAVYEQSLLLLAGLPDTSWALHANATLQGVAQ